MKLTALSAIITTLLTLAVVPDTVMAASAKRHKCMARPGGHHKHGQGQISMTASFTSTTMEATGSPLFPPLPDPPKASDPAPAPPKNISPPPSPAPEPQPAPAPAPAPSPKPSPNPAPAPPSSGLTADEQAYLSAHNTIRQNKGAPALTWNDTLATYAKGVSNTCVFKHSGGPYGENLSAGTHSFSIAAAIKLWTDEEKDYNPANPQFSHYTQVVWKGSRQLGCAISTCATLVDAFDNADYYVCEYYPPGNVIGEFGQNVEA